MKTVIIAGGQGTRIASVNSEIPKGMIPVAGKPIIEHELELCLRHGLSDFIFITGYLGDQIDAGGHTSPISEKSTLWALRVHWGC